MCSKGSFMPSTRKDFSLESRAHNVDINDGLTDSDGKTSNALDVDRSEKIGISRYKRRIKRIGAGFSLCIKPSICGLLSFVSLLACIAQFAHTLAAVLLIFSAVFFFVCNCISGKNHSI